MLFRPRVACEFQKAANVNRPGRFRRARPGRVRRRKAPPRGEEQRERFILKHTVSIKQNRDFRRLYARGKSAVTPCLVLYCQKNRQGKSRLGITVGGKVGKAVLRNRVRRRLREAYRTNEGGFLPGYDLVVVARVKAGQTSYAQLERHLLSLAKKLGVFREGAA